MKHMRIQGWLATSLLVASLWSGTPAFAAGVGDEVKVVANQPQPSNAGIDLSKKYVVWIPKDDRENAIVLLDFDENTEKRIGADGHPKTNPQVDENYLAWIDLKNGNGEVVVYDIDKKQEKRLTNSNASPSDLSIGGNYAVWTDKRNGGSDVYAYDMKNDREFRVSHSGKASKPSVSKTYITWQDERNGNSDVYFYNIPDQEEGYVTLNIRDQTNPYAATGYIVYEEGASLAYYDLSSGKIKSPLADNVSAKLPLIYDDYIVFQSKNDLKYYDLSEKRTRNIVGKIYDKIPPAIYGDYVIYAKLDEEDVPRLHMYDMEEEEDISLGSHSGEPSEPSGDDRYVVYISEGKKDNTAILVNMKTSVSAVVSDSNQDPKRPLVSGSYVVFYDDDEESLISYNIKTGKREQITDDKNEPSNSLYELYGSKLVWLDEGRSPYINVTDLSTGKTEEIKSLKNNPLSIDINENFVAWLTDEGSDGGKIYAYDLRDGYEMEVTEEEVNAENISLGSNFLVWSQKDEDWEMYYYNLDTQRTFPVLRDAAADQVRPQASGDLILFEDNRYQRNSKTFLYQLFDVEESDYVDYYLSDDAEPSHVRLEGNRLVWIDERENDPYVYTMEVADPKDDGDDDDNPGEPFRDYNLSELLDSGKTASIIGGHPLDKVVFIFNPGTSEEVQFKLDRVFEDTDKLIELLNNTPYEKVTIRVYK